MFGQTFNVDDLAVVSLLALLEGVMSLDNALVLGLLAKRLPGPLQKRALTYGLVGAILFRLIAIGAAAYLLHWHWMKLVGSLYLLYVGVKYFFSPDHHAPANDPPTPTPADSSPPAPADLTTHSWRFWYAVFVIEMTDIAFAVDSILAAIALVGDHPAGPNASELHPKLWVVLVGGMLGVLMMRLAAVIFIKLLNRFPRFNMVAYLLVMLIGAKLLADWAFNTTAHPHRLNFHDPARVEFWIFWGLMTGTFLLGFLPKRAKEKAAAPNTPP